MADGRQDVLQLAILGKRVVDVVGDHDRQAELRGELGSLGDQPVVIGEQVMRELDEEPAGRRAVAPPEERGVPLRHRPRPRPVADPQPAGQLPVTAARQRHQALRVRARAAPG